MALEKIDTVILAGGINRIPLFEGDAPTWKALLPFAGRPCIQYVLDALGEIPEIGRTCLVGPEEPLRMKIAEPDRYEYAPEGQTFGGSVFSGMAHFPEAQTILFLTADLPLLTASPVIDFLAACRRVPDQERKLFLSGIDRNRFTGNYQGVPKRCSRFRDVTVCHGNIALVPSLSLRENGPVSKQRLDAIYRSRKTTLRTCWAFGWPFALGYVAGTKALRPFTLGQVLKFASWHFRVELVPVFLDDPSVCLDVDEPADYRFAVDFLQKRRAPSR